MICRLGHVISAFFYFLAGFCILNVIAAFFVRKPVSWEDVILLIILAGILFLVGKAFRYVLSNS